MVTKKIESLQHPLVKHWLRLRLEKAYREEAQRVLVVGEKMARELPLEVLIAVEPRGVSAKEIYLVSEPILKKITGLNQPDGFAAEVSLPKEQSLQGKSFLLILDQIADPGNLGTLLRTAAAFGWEGIILTPGTVDLFNDKALRAAKGATFHLPYCWLQPEEISQLNVPLFTADLQGEELRTVAFKPPLGLVLSSEARGAHSWSLKIGRRVTIPMCGKVESLNVAASGAILLYAMRSP